MSFFIKYFRALAVASILIGASYASSAARDPGIVEYPPFFVDMAYPGVILMAGPIDRRAALNFKRIIEKSGSPEVLLLASTGGIVDVALSIAFEIDQLGLTTIITEESGCYSACAFLFLAGHNRLAFGELGVHQLSNETGDLTQGQLALSDVIDILDRFDVPSQMVVDMLRTPADEMHAYGPQELEALGVTGPREQGSRDIERRAPQEHAAPQPRTGRSASELAIDFIADVNKSWSSDNNQALNDLHSIYSFNVEFYGNHWTQQQVIDDKRAFARRWPNRKYQLDRRRTQASCSKSSCTVTGIVHWRVNSPRRNASASGSSEIVLRLDRSNGNFSIRYENGRVISRN